MSLTKEILKSNGFWVLNKTLVKKIGLSETFILSCFAECEQLKSDDDGWFFQTIEIIEELSGLTRHQQSQYIAKLKDLGIISQQNRGVPCKRYFKINHDILEQIMLQGVETSLLKIGKLDVKKFTNQKLKNLQTIYKELNKELNNKELNNKELSKKKNKISTEADAVPKTSKKKYGEYSHVLLTDEQFENLKSEFNNYEELIKHLDEYKEMKDYKTKNDYLTIKKWVVDAVKEKDKKTGTANKSKPKERPEGKVEIIRSNKTYDEALMEYVAKMDEENRKRSEEISKKIKVIPCDYPSEQEEEQTIDVEIPF